MKKIIVVITIFSMIFLLINLFLVGIYMYKGLTNKVTEVKLESPEEIHILEKDSGYSQYNRRGFYNWKVGNDDEMT
jgi:uncharacterized protein YpmB